MNLSRLALATVAAASMIAAPAAAQTTEPEPLVNKSFYFQCQSPTGKVENSPLFETPTWTETKPTASFTSGAGCGFADTGLTGTSPDNPLYDAVFGGTWDERVKTMTVELHDLVLSQTQSNTLGNVSFTAHLLIDGAAVTPEAGVELEAVPTISSTGASQSMKFGITFRNELPKLEGRQFTLGIKATYIDGPFAWVLGAAEVPAGVEFNQAGKLPPAKFTV